MFPSLKQSFKHRFPFRLSAPSFIYPADYVTNVHHLGAYLDEIELLLFESRPGAIPTRSEIDRLAELARQLDLTYNVHLPLDLNLGTASLRERQTCIDRLVSVIDRIGPLTPTTHTLHLNFREKAMNAAVIQRWQARTTATLSRLLDQANLAPRSLSIETLDYPPHWLEHMVEELDLAVCVDVGHLLYHGHDLETVLSRFAHRITILHLHGVENGQDHRSLYALPEHARRIMQRYLTGFSGSVSLEVFALEPLQASLDCLAGMINGGAGAA